ncbi:MAG: copper amine oxidase N-terminal domain-containing protein [Syntrophomonadaceae bacterium]|jgi:hypothetical protein
MRKEPLSTLKILLATMFMVALLVLPALALDPQPEPPMITILIDGRPLITDVSPIIQNERTLVPLRAIFEALGAEVFWNDTERSIKAVKGDLTVQLQIANTMAIKNGTTVPIDVPAQILQDRTLVPVRFVSEALGADVQWDQVLRRVTITSAASPDSTIADSQTEPLPIIPPVNITPGNSLLRLMDTSNLDIRAHQAD